MNTKTTPKTTDNKSAGNAGKSSSGQGAQKTTDVQKDAESRSRGESPSANKSKDRSPRQENL